MINNNTDFPDSIDFVLNIYENITLILEHQNETPIIYEILDFIMTKIEMLENYLLFTNNFHKVK